MALSEERGALGGQEGGEPRETRASADGSVDRAPRGARCCGNGRGVRLGTLFDELRWTGAAAAAERSPNAPRAPGRRNGPAAAV